MMYREQFSTWCLMCSCDGLPLAAQQKMRLFKAMEWYAAQALAFNTRRNYCSHAHAFVAYCVTWGFWPLLPVTDAVLAQYLIYASDSAKPQSLRVYLSGIRTFSLDNGFEWPHITSLERRLTYKTYCGLKHKHGAPAEPKLALTLEHLVQFYNVIQQQPAERQGSWRAWWAAALVAFFLMLRKDNVTMQKADAFNNGSHLCLGDFYPKGGKWTDPPGTITSVTVIIRQSKTNQSGERLHVVALPCIRNSILCPVEALRRLFLGMGHQHPRAPAFQKVGQGMAAPLVHKEFVDMLHGLLVKIGLEPTSFSGHSFRRGGATLAFKITQDHSLIMYQGDWASAAYLGYKQHDSESILQLPQLFALHVSEQTRRG
jgi:hypothetical protein